MKNQKFFKAGLAIPVAVSASLTGISVQTEEVSAATTTPELVITELLANSSNVESKDAFEYIEIYNQSAVAVNLNNYAIKYTNVDGAKETIWNFAKIDQVIEPGKSIVVWIKNTGIVSQLTLENFNTNYGVNLTEDQINTVSSAGMSNANNVKVSVVKTTQEVVSEVTYAPTDVVDQKGIHYKTDGTKISTDIATPGVVAEGQVVSTEPPTDPSNPTTPTEYIATITNSSAANHDSSSDFLATFTVNTNDSVQAAYIYYRSLTEGTWLKRPMTLNAATGQYEINISKDELVSQSIQYKFSVVGANKTFESDIYSTNLSGIAFDATKAPALLITELVPDTTNIGVSTSDGYEFIEVYNNSTQDINLKGYKVVYQYPSTTTPDANWYTEERDYILKSGDTVVYWIKNAENQALTVADFNTFYKTNYDESKIIPFSAGGLANNSYRGIAIVNPDGNPVSNAYYYDQAGIDDTVVDKGIHYAYPQNGSIKQIKYDYAETAATPGVVSSIQVPATKVSPSNPANPQETTATFTHTATPTIALTDFKPSVQIETTDTIQSAYIYYRSLTEGTWMKRELKLNVATGNYDALIPSLELVSSSIQYKFSMVGVTKTYESDIYSSEVEGITFDEAKAPPLLITELVPDSTNVGNGDGYEYIEIYNNSNEDINLKDYTIRYRYPMEGSEADLVWNPKKRDVILKSGETLIYWIKNKNNQDKTLADFNLFYNKNFDDNKVIEIHSDGMANGSHRGIVIATNTGKEISAAYYYDQPNVDDVGANQGIHYAYPQNGSTNQIKYEYAETPATPGDIKAIQVPITKVTLPTDSTQPAIVDQTVNETVAHGENASLKFSITDDTSVKTARLYYKVDDMSTYQVVDLQESNQDYYEHTIYYPELINKNQIEYYLEVSDGVNTVQTDVATLQIEKGQIKADGLNIDSGAVVSKTVAVKAYDKNASLIVNGQDVKGQSQKAVAETGYFVFDVKKTNVFFKNGVTMGDEILYIFDDMINQYQTISVPLTPERFKENTPIELALRAGTKVSPLDTASEENRDDFYMKNPRLVLADGSIVQDVNYTDALKEHTVGDGGTATPVYNFSFNVPDAAYTAIQYNWDTTQLADGTYQIQSGNQIIDVTVDNTAPSITPTINGQPVTAEALKGNIQLDAAVEDATTIQQLEATLDGKAIQLPYDTNSAKLTAGEHTLDIKATDAGGNSTSKTITFTVVDELPTAPVLVKPEGTADRANAAKLEVNVADPTNDELLVTFYEGKHIEATDAEMNVFENSSETEPPTTQIVAGEAVVQNKEALKKADGAYVQTSSKTKFPYHRFNVAVGEELTADDEIAIDWEGKSLPGRKVSMYVWNYAIAKWELQTFYIAKDEQNFTLNSKIMASDDYVKDGEIQVIIQDEIAQDALADYSLVWMSDTQYYSESYPHIFDAMTNWVKDNTEQLNIKYVFHTGDLVDQAEQPYQWDNANKSMKVLEDAQVPYGVLAGNHDVGHKTGDYNAYSEHFGEGRFNNKPFYGQSYKNNRGHYDLISANGNDFIMLYMGWGVNDEDIEWMNKVLADHPNRIAILNFHEYLLVSGNRSPIGNEIYEKVVKKNPNVVAVLSGHYHDAETLVDTLDDNGDGVADRKVYQMLADYQGGPEGGSGYLRILKVNQATNKIAIQTYSPYLNDYNYYEPSEYPGKDEIEMDVDLAPKEKVVATDKFEIKVYKDEMISQPVKAVNKTVSTDWTGLKPNQEYGFYVNVEDQFGGAIRSDLWSFRTKASDGDAPTPTPNPPANEEQIQSATDVTLKEELLNTASPTVELILPQQQNSNKPTVITFTDDILDKAIAAKKEIKITYSNNIELLLDTATLLQLASQTGDVKLEIDEKEKSEVSPIKGKVYSTIIDVDVAVNNNSVQLDQGLTLRVPLSNLNGNKVLAGSYFNELTNSWQYAGGKIENGQLILNVTQPGMYTVSSADVNFKDINKHWAKDAIHTLTAKRIINGATENNFNPNATLTRKQFTLMLARSLQLPVNEYEGTFEDVAGANQYDTLLIEAAKRYGIINGSNTGEFNPNDVITREQMITILSRAIQLKKPELLAESDASSKKFTDMQNVSGYAKEHVELVANLGFINGKANGELKPKDPSTRGQSASIIQRLVEILEQ